jgi:hypothetical protein
MSESEPTPAADDEPTPGQAAPNVELPSPQAVVNELEEFLRQLRREDNGDE